MVNDFYARFVNQEASEKKKVAVGRIATFLMMITAGLLSLILEEARDAFNLLLQIGAGTGLLFILRWFWLRINPYSEIAAMLSSFLIAIFFFINSKLEQPLITWESHWELVFGVVFTTIVWVVTTLLTQPSNEETLANFQNLVFDKEGKFHYFNYKVLAFFTGTIGIYAILFGTGFWIYAEITSAIIAYLIASVCSLFIWKNWNKIV